VQDQQVVTGRVGGGADYDVLVESHKTSVVGCRQREQVHISNLLMARQASAR